MPTSVTVSMSLPVARSRTTSLNRSDPSSSTRVASRLPSGLTAKAPSRKYSLPSASAFSLKISVVCAASRRLAVPVAILRALLERRPVKPVAVLQRDRAVVFLDAALHLLEQRFDQRRVRLHRRFEIGVLGLQIVEHVLVIDLGIALVAKPGIGVLDADRRGARSCRGAVRRAAGREGWSLVMVAFWARAGEVAKMVAASAAASATDNFIDTLPRSG